MAACPSAEPIARYRPVGGLSRVDCPMPDQVRDNRGYLETLGREQGDAFGGDKNGNFDHEPRPSRDFHPAFSAVSAAVVVRSFGSNNLLTLRRRSGDAGI